MTGSDHRTADDEDLKNCGSTVTMLVVRLYSYERACKTWFPVNPPPHCHNPYFYWASIIEGRKSSFLSPIIPKSSNKAHQLSQAVSDFPNHLYRLKSDDPSLKATLRLWRALTPESDKYSKGWFIIKLKIWSSIINDDGSGVESDERRGSEKKPELSSLHKALPVEAPSKGQNWSPGNVSSFSVISSSCTIIWDWGWLEIFWAPLW